MAIPVCFTHTRAPGDIVCMTAAIRDLAMTYPGEFEIHVAVSCRPLFEGNPHIVGLHRQKPRGMEHMQLDYGRYMPNAKRAKMHFITAFHRDLKRLLDVEVPVLKPHGDLYLTEEQKAESPIEGRYWYIIAGGKTDFTAKVWSYAKWQKTIDLLREQGIQFVQDGALHKNHYQPTLANVLNTVNRTSLRDMLWLIYHADGVICGVTAAMHMAAALEKPCVVIAGGREHWWWEAYVNTDMQIFGPRCSPVRVPHRFLHTIGLLPCAEKDDGCWRNKVLRSEHDKHRRYCKFPVDDGYGQMYPQCMHMITPQHVADAVLSYYTEGVHGPHDTEDLPDLSSADRALATN